MLKFIKPNKMENYAKYFKLEPNRLTKDKIVTEYEFEHLMEIDEKEKEITFTACVKICYDNKYGRKLLKKMLTKQNSPIKIILQESDADARAYVRDEKQTDRYTVPDEILKMIEDDEKRKKES